MATHEPTQPQAHSHNYWPWGLLMWFVLIVAIIGTLVVWGGYNWSAGGNQQNMPRQNIQGEQPLQVAPGAGSPGGLAPADGEHDPLRR